MPGDESVWLISLSLVSSSSIHGVAHVRIPLPFKREEYSIVWLYYNFLIHSSIHGHLSCFLPPFGYCEYCCYEHGCPNTSSKPSFQFPGREVAGSCGNPCLTFEACHYCFPQLQAGGCSTSRPYSRAQGSQLLYFLANTYYFLGFVCFL